jgi:hypothetical protein
VKTPSCQKKSSTYSELYLERIFAFLSLNELRCDEVRRVMTSSATLTIDNMTAYHQYLQALAPHV